VSHLTSRKTAAQAGKASCEEQKHNFFPIKMHFSSNHCPDLFAAVDACIIVTLGSSVPKSNDLLKLERKTSILNDMKKLGKCLVLCGDAKLEDNGLDPAKGNNRVSLFLDRTRRTTI
jgi:hypothetical protein